MLIHNPATPVGLTPKLHRRYGDVWIIVGKDGPTNYLLQHADTGKRLEHPIHVQRLKLYFDNRDRFQSKGPHVNKQCTYSSRHSPVADRAPQLPAEPSRTTELEDSSSQSPVTAVSRIHHPADQSSTTSASPATAEKGHDSAWFAVTKLLAVRTQNSKRQYKVQRRDYPPSWENAENISDYLKQTFHERHTQQGTLRKTYARQRKAGRRA